MSHPSSTIDTNSKGMTQFLFLWIGQMVSVLTTNMTNFAITIWIYQKSGSAINLGLMQFFFFAPFLLLSPIAGVMIDRYSRKIMMMASDACAGCATLMILLLHATHNLQLWHIYAASVLHGMGNTFQWPAYSAAISTMVSKKQLGRVNGMMSLIEAGPGVLGPILAASLLPIVGLSGILIGDIITFIIALIIILFITVPNPTKSFSGKVSNSYLEEAAFGFKYIFSRPSLLGLQLLFFLCNIFSSMAFALIAPMILSRTNQSATILGTIRSASAIAAVVGGILMSLWGGFNRKIHGVILGWFITGLFGFVLFGLSQSIVAWIITGTFYSIVVPIVNGSNQALWQAKVSPDLQGRVFATRRFIAWFSLPIAPVIAGVLADKVFEPAMKNDTIIQHIFSPLFGTGAGAGMGIVITVCGIFISLTAISGYAISAIRNAEDLLPDYDKKKV